jgi:ankyrin repeat protein
MTRFLGICALCTLFTTMLIACSQKNADLVDAASSGNLQKVESLLKDGADIEASSMDGLTPLEAAAKSGHLPVVRYLIERGASVNGDGKSDRTALGLAIIYEHTDCAEYLAKNGGQLRGTDTWKEGLLSTLRKDNKPELIDLVQQQRAKSAP